MAYQQIASGNALDLANLEQYEAQIGEGDRCLLELDLNTDAPSWSVSWLGEQMQAKGIPEAKVESGSPKLRVFWRKGFAWIPIIIVLVLTFALLIIGWRLFKDVSAVVPAPLLSIGLIALIVLGIVALTKRR